MVCKLHKRFVTFPYTEAIFMFEGFSIVIYGKFNSNYLVFFSFFMCSVNYSSLTFKIWILFWTFRHLWMVLKCYTIFGTVLRRTINFNRRPLFSYFLLVNILYNLKFFKLQKIYFRYVQKIKRYLYFWDFLMIFHLWKVQF